ncbi:MAG: beta galactosidase jelly roll domain-containing protein [Victivallales bacterium]|nr:beta galactosidase jelly roll domain-containing protein [Victivallales bacterium]
MTCRSLAVFAAGCIAALATGCATGTPESTPPPGMAKIQNIKTPDQCRQILKTENDEVVRRVAFRKLLFNQQTTDEAITLGLNDKDAKIRASAIYELYVRDGVKALPQLKAMLNDPSQEVGLVLVEIGRSLPERKQAVAFLQELIAKNKSAEVRRNASQAIGFAFFRENIAYSMNPVHDHEITLVKSIELPFDGWKFMPDSSNTGHLDNNQWYRADLDDSKWAPIAINNIWEEQGFATYDGFAWYRFKFTLPEKIEGAATELCFGAVDECAWVWLNDSYIGQHDEGPNGWKTPFKLDITKEVKWGAENVLVVRVEDTEGAGGIWKPVTVEVVK